MRVSSSTTCDLLQDIRGGERRSVAPSYPGAVPLGAMKVLLAGGRDVLGDVTRGAY